MISMTATRKAGELAGINDRKYAGRVFTVTKVNPTTYVLTPKDGIGRPIRVPHEMAIDATEAGTSQDVPIGQPYEPWQYICPGTVVRVKGRKSYPGLEAGKTLCVVLADKGDKVNVTALGGGMGDRYLRCPHGLLETVPVDEVAGILMDQGIVK